VAFSIRDQVLGPIIVRVASFFPFHATYWLNGHSFHRTRNDQSRNRQVMVNGHEYVAYQGAKVGIHFTKGGELFYSDF
jgi:hypothetical protein